ncbi:hypothetical protein PHYPO_G00146690 [Pangasianodon hypophthalmus]|uniref:Uncharacterized protein n=1 Tax=Pangasianodon hypophthalmus TaxID=310915 RepID=A0A5N5K9R3_PANHP|nr:hypothetical protein PHYPO_G00146690 [Pangasianodon hypophthalmus]
MDAAERQEWGLQLGADGKRRRTRLSQPPTPPSPSPSPLRVTFIFAFSLLGLFSAEWPVRMPRGRAGEEQRVYKSEKSCGITGLLMDT